MRIHTNSCLKVRLEKLEKTLAAFQAQVFERLEQMEQENRLLLDYLDTKVDNKIQSHLWHADQNLDNLKGELSIVKKEMESAISQLEGQLEWNQLRYGTARELA